MDNNETQTSAAVELADAIRSEPQARAARPRLSLVGYTLTCYNNGLIYVSGKLRRLLNVNLGDEDGRMVAIYVSESGRILIEKVTPETPSANRYRLTYNAMLSCAAITNLARKLRLKGKLAATLVNNESRLAVWEMHKLKEEQDARKAMAVVGEPPAAIDGEPGAESDADAA